MPTVTKLLPQKRNPDRRSVYLDGDFAFGVNLNVVAAFRLREGQQLTAEQVDAILRGEVRQECFDHGLRLLARRLHSRAELRRKLGRREYGDPVIDPVLDDLARLGYLDDERFAAAMAQSLRQHRRVGARRAVVELVRAGVPVDLAQRAAADAYATSDPVAEAKRLVAKQAARLRALDPQVARRRLAGLLQRRGYDLDTVRAVADAVLGRGGDDE